MGTLTRLGLGATLATALLAVTGCSNNGTTGTPDLAMTPTADMTSGGGGELGFQLPDIGPLADLNGSAVVRVTGGFAQPYSVFFDATTNAWYVSNVAGDISDINNLKDGKGWITKISADYKTVDHAFFATGLNAPSGIRIVGGKLYFADVDQLVVVDIAARTAVRSATVTPPFAGLPVFLTDTVVDGAGAAYVSEAVLSRIIKFASPMTAGATYTQFSPQGVSVPTALYLDGTTKLVVGTSANPQMAGSTGSIYTMTLTGTNVTKLGTFTGSFNGIEKDGTSYLVGTQRGATVEKIDAMSGAQTTLQNCKSEGAVSVVDIGWDSTNRILAVPDAGTNSIYFYKQ